LPQYDLSTHYGPVNAQVSAFDRLPGSFAAANAGISQLSIPASSSPSNWFQCALCQSLTGQQDGYVTQAALQPGAPSGLPAQAVLFETAVDLAAVAPASFSADLFLNTTKATMGKANSAFLGYSHGYSASATGFNDGYVIYSMPMNDGIFLSLAYATAYHVPAPSPSAAPPLHTSDVVATITVPSNVSATLLAPTTIQIGSQFTPGGHTIGLIQQIARTQSQDTNPYDLVIPGRANDYNASVEYLDRGTSFAPPDTGVADLLAGLHGFAGSATYLPRAPIYDRNLDPLRTQPMSVSLSGYHFADGAPRFSNLSASVAVPIRNGFQITGQASLGYIAASAASTNFSAAALTDAAGGTARIPQSNVEFDVGYATGQYDRNTKAFPGLSWGAQLGLANQSQAECNITLTATPCAAERASHFTYNSFVAGPAGFFSLSVGPALLPVAGLGTSSNADATTPHQFGSFINHTSYSVTAAVHVPSLQPKICNSIIVTANNTTPPPEIAVARPTTGSSVSAYFEALSLDTPSIVALFAGVSHTTSNVAQPTFGSPNVQFVSTVTYALKLSVGTEGYRYNLRNSCTFRKPT
jgi:hypothetical protein